MPPKPQRYCIFCNGPHLTGEHVFSEWLHPYLDINPTGHRLKEAGRLMDDSEPTMRLSSLPKKGEKVTSMKLDVVCKPCNGIWMSALDVAVRPHLVPLVQGQKHS